MPDGSGLRLDEHQSLAGSMDDFLQASPGELLVLVEHLRDVRDDWATAIVRARITDRAARLNQSSPLAPGGPLQPRDRHTDLAQATTYAWIDPNTVVSGNAATWNDFADHRPDQVPMIINKLLTDSDTRAAACFVLAYDGIAQVRRINGPKGPIHEVTGNGTHRTHALRMLEAPLMAVEVTVEPLPLRLSVFDVQRPDTSFEDVAALWRGLLSRGLIAGSLGGEDTFAQLHLEHAVAPWMLLTADRAATVSRAYERIYPGTLANLGIPGRAVTTGWAWQNWLT